MPRESPRPHSAIGAVTRYSPSRKGRRAVRCCTAGVTSPRSLWSPLVLFATRLFSGTCRTTDVPSSSLTDSFTRGTAGAASASAHITEHLRSLFVFRDIFQRLIAYFASTALPSVAGWQQIEHHVVRVVQSVVRRR